LSMFDRRVLLKRGKNIQGARQEEKRVCRKKHLQNPKLPRAPPKKGTSQSNEGEGASR